MTGERAAYLLEVAHTLWPEAGTVRAGRGATGELTFLLVPGAADPRLVLPADRRAASVAVRRYAATRSVRAAVRSRVLSAAVRTGLGGLLLRDRLAVSGTTGSLVGHLESVLGRELAVSFHLGPPRANRKPVLQLQDPAGPTVGFAKVGVDPLTTALVDAEHAALRSLAKVALRTAEVPEALHHGPWGDEGAVLVQSALPVWEGDREVDPAVRGAAMREVAEHAGVETAVPAATGWAAGLRDRVGRVPDRGTREVLAGALAADGGTPLPFGAWHGDWTPWNMTVRRGRALVWDWERFGVGVPVGFDAVHYALQAALWKDADPRGTTERVVAGLPAVLAPFGLSEPQARRVGALYLVEIAARYALDGQAEAGARLGRLDTWLLPVLASTTTSREEPRG